MPKEVTEENEGILSTLGILWDRKLDILYVKVNLDCPSEPNKRNTLKFLASIYDPLGFFRLSTLKLKLFIQRCWKNKFDWSERLPSTFEAELHKICSDLSYIVSISIPRKLCKFSKIGTISLHIFCDASKAAFACCTYLVYFNSETCQNASTLIISKVRTAPLKSVSIPRLELLGVLIGKRLAMFLKVWH